MMRAWVIGALLAAAVGNANAQEAGPDEDFLVFLGGLEADGDWQEFFESVPDDIPGRTAPADDEQDDTEDGNELD